MRDMEAGMEQALMNIRQLLESRVRQHPEKAFVIFEDQVTSYADFDTTVNRVASGFLRLGIRAGDRVCVMLSNCPEFRCCPSIACMKRLRSDVGNLLIESVAKVRRYSIAQQLLHGPHMVRQSCCHSRCDQLPLLR